MKKIILIHFALISLVLGEKPINWVNNFDTVTTIHAQLFSSYGNHLSGFKEPSSISKDPSFYEVGFKIDFNFNKQYGFDLRFGTVFNKEILLQSTYNTEVKYAIARLYLNGKYFAAKFGINYHEQRRPYFNEQIDNANNIGPIFSINAGLINRLYLDVSILDDALYTDRISLYYHFEGHFNQIWLSRIKDGNIIGLQILLVNNITVMSQGLFYELKNYKSIRVGLGYIF